MRTLIDTNVFIYREDNQVLAANLSELLKMISSLQMTILVHPKSLEEIGNDKDSRRREIALSKIRAYLTLESPPLPDLDKDYSDLVGSLLGSAESVDNLLLYSLYRSAVDYLITEDRQLLRAAGVVGLQNRALSIDSAVRLFTKWSANKEIPRPPALVDIPVHNLRISDPIFSQLKGNYSEFEEWFRKVSAQGRRCWVYFNQDRTIGALLIYKIEQEAVDCNPPLPVKRRLKLSTLVVTYRGYKIGELFVKLAVHHAITNDCEEAYLTHFTVPGDQLVTLLTDYGFEKVGRNQRGEDVFLKPIFPSKELIRHASPAEVSQRYYPAFCDSMRVGKFIIPIRPEYHQRLFVDYRNRQTTLGEYQGEFIVEGNTIKKAYICNSGNRTLARGDIVLFYRSVDLQEITSLGVVENVYRIRDVRQILKLVEKRTVYSIDEIKRLLKRRTLTILFNWHFHLPRPIGITKLHEIGIFAPQSIVKIAESQYQEIKELGDLDRRFAFD